MERSEMFPFYHFKNHSRWIRFLCKSFFIICISQFMKKIPYIADWRNWHTGKVDSKRQIHYIFYLKIMLVKQRIFLFTAWKKLPEEKILWNSEQAYNFLGPISLLEQGLRRLIKKQTFELWAEHKKIMTYQISSQFSRL